MKGCCRHRKEVHRSWSNRTETFTVCLDCEGEEWYAQSVHIEDLDELCAAVDKVARHEYRGPTP